MHRLNSNFQNPAKVTVSAVGGVAINDQNVYKAGKFVFGSIRFTLSSTINANSTALGSFPLPATSMSGGYAVASFASNRKDIPFALLANGQVTPTENATAQTYVISVAYISAS